MRKARLSLDTHVDPRTGTLRVGTAKSHAVSARRPLRFDEPLVLDLGSALPEAAGQRWCLPVRRAADGALQADLHPLVREARHQQHPLTVELRVRCAATGDIAAACDWYAAIDAAAPSDGATDPATRLLRELHGSFFCCELFRLLKAEATAPASAYTTAADAIASGRDESALGVDDYSSWDFGFDREESQPPRHELLGFTEHSFTMRLGAHHALSCALIDRRAAGALGDDGGDGDAQQCELLRVLCRVALLRIGQLVYEATKTASEVESGSTSSPPVLLPVLRRVLAGGVLARETLRECLAVVAARAGLELSVSFDSVAQPWRFDSVAQPWRATVTALTESGRELAARTVLGITSDGGDVITLFGPRGARRCHAVGPALCRAIESQLGGR